MVKIEVEVSMLFAHFAHKFPIIPEKWRGISLAMASRARE